MKKTELRPDIMASFINKGAAPGAKEKDAAAPQGAGAAPRTYTVDGEIFELPETRKRRVQALLTQSIYDRAKTRAEEEHTSVNNIIMQALDEYLTKRGI